MAQVSLDLQDADGHLPNACMCCGEEASTTKTRNMSWCPPWVGVLFLAGLLPYIIVAMIMTKRARIQVPLCEQHEGHWFKRNLIVWGSFVAIGFMVALLLLALMILPKDIQDKIGPFLCIGCVVLGIAWLVVLIVAQSTAIRPKEITDHQITLDGVSPLFVDVMQKIERKRRARSRNRRRDEDDEDMEEDDRPRKKRIVSDAIEEERPRKKTRGTDGIEDDRPRKKKPRADDDD